MLPRYAVFLSPGWTEDNDNPSYRSGIITVDTGAYGDVRVGQSNMFCYGCFNRNHCGFEPHARAIRTLPGAYRSAGFKIDPDPIGVRQIREIDGCTGSVVSLATGPNIGVYAGDSHIPFPNTPVLRGIGLKWPTIQTEQLSYCQRAVVLGADYQFGQMDDISRSAIEHAVVNAPPLCMYRHALWGASRHFPRNLPDMSNTERRAARLLSTTKTVTLIIKVHGLGLYPNNRRPLGFSPHCYNR